MSGDFSVEEYQERVKRAQIRMEALGFDALLLTTKVEFTYFSGFYTQFWESPTRPWFLLLPRTGDPIAIIPAIGVQLMASTWIRDIRTWSAPNLQSDGIDILRDAIIEIIGPSGKIALPSGMETHLRMPLNDLAQLQQMIGPITCVWDEGLTRDLRVVKSVAEIERVENSCNIAARAFARVGEIVREGTTKSQIFRNFQMLCLEEGADNVPYLAGGFGANGYGDVISPADDQTIESGDILMLDTGLVSNRYFCDFDRNFVLGKPNQLVADAHKKLVEASNLVINEIKPGMRCSDVYTKLANALGSSDNVGRMGHGLGLQLTEWPSIMADEDFILEKNMVMTIEPSIETVDGMMLVHEENIVITANGCRQLTPHNNGEIVRI